MTTYGVFSDEGMVSGPFYSFEAAEVARRANDPEHLSGLRVARVCGDHPEASVDDESM